MTWTRLSDDWTDSVDLAKLPFDTRWHYLAMIQLCSRSGRIDGVLRTVDARRCSDVPEPAAAISNLVGTGLVELVRDGVRIVRIEDHVPPPSVRNKAEADKLRKRRERAHKAGDHSLCVAPFCTHVTSDVTRDSGPGQDGPDTRTPSSTVTWNVVPIPVPITETRIDPETGEIEEVF